MDNYQMIRIAKLYYELDKTQKEIAEIEDISRSKVSRMLTRAEDRGLIELRVKSPHTSVYDVERELILKYNLKAATVIPVFINNSNIILQDIGKAAGEFLVDTLNSDDIIGVSWGTTMSYVADNLPENDIINTKIVQLNGGLSHGKSSTTANIIVNKFARAFGGESFLMPVPAIVDDSNIAEAILSDSNIKQIFSLCQKARLVMFGIGYFSRDSVLYKAGYFDEEQSFKRLKEKGAVGDIMARFFDINGEICDEKMNSRTIGQSFDDIKKAEYSVGVASGDHKVEPIIGALRGDYINTLITDENTARKILDYND